VLLFGMGVSFDSVSLSGEQASQALPLVQVIWPGVDVAAWQRSVRFFSEEAGASGVLAVRNEARYLCGVLAYRTDWDLQRDPILAVRVFAAMDLVNSLVTVRGLLDAAEMRAHQLDCAGVEIRLSTKQKGLAARLRALGVSSHADVFCFTLAPGHALS
jgi:hypothetical protein